MTDTDSREELLQAANDARTELMHTVGRLDKRGHQAFDLTKQIGRLLPAALAVAICVTVVAAHYLSTRGRRRGARWRLAQRLWRQDRPFAIEVARSLLVSLVASGLAFSLRHALHRTVDAP